MKTLKLIAYSFLFISFSSFAQFDVSFGTFDVTEAFKVEIAAHDASPVIQRSISEVEIKYAVTCDGFTTPDYPYVQSRMTYKATCIGAGKKIKLKLKSKYVSSPEGFLFSIKKYSVKIK